MIAVMCVTFLTISFWWVLRQTVWNTWAPVKWRLGLIGLELLVTIAFAIGQYEPDPLTLRVGWSVLNLLVFSVFVYYLDRQPVKNR